MRWLARAYGTSKPGAIRLNYGMQRVRGGGKSIVQNKTIGSTKSKADGSVTIPLGQSPPVGQAATVTVSIAPVPGEKNTTNNRQQYTVIFTR